MYFTERNSVTEDTKNDHQVVDHWDADQAHAMEECAGKNGIRMNKRELEMLGVCVIS